MEHTGYAVYLGLDVGKSEHHAVGLAPDGRRLHDAPLPNTEEQLKALYTQLSAHGNVLVIVDQPASIGALPVTVARAVGVQVAYLPGLVMRRLADLHPGTAKTDPRDAYIIADAARTLPHTLRRVNAGDDTLAELSVLVGFDDDLAAEATRLTNRIRGLLTGLHPALERVLGPKTTHPAVLELLACFGGPLGLAAAGRKLTTTALKHPRMGARLAEDTRSALSQQTVVVPGTTAAETVLPRLATSLRDADVHRRVFRHYSLHHLLDSAAALGHVTGSPGLGLLRRLRPALARSAVGAPSPSATLDDRRVGRTRTVPVFTAIRSSK